MLSYLHGFHAGNFADVQKHAALSLALTMMQVKPSAIACFDTHAGSGLYDLQGERARKTAEADGGVQRLWAQRGQLQSPDWQPVIAQLQRLNGDVEPLQRYPGSPEWFRQARREQDALSLFELHSTEGGQLQQVMDVPGVRVCREDGLKGLLKALPPGLPRLLVLIDPSYEIKQDYAAVADTLAKAWRRCRHGVYLIWYPILTAGQQQDLLETVAAGPVRKILRNEVMLRQPPQRGMVGSGMLVVNPPWEFEARFLAMMTDVATRDCLDVAVNQDWLVPE